MMVCLIMMKSSRLKVFFRNHPISFGQHRMPPTDMAVPVTVNGDVSGDVKDSVFDITAYLNSLVLN